MSTPTEVRSAVSGDAAFIHAMIVGLAEYERAREQVTGTVEQLHEALFGADPSAEALIAERDGAPVGMALFYRTFSTWECVPGIWLEDIYVLPEHRRSGADGTPGVGESLLRALAALTIERGYTRLEWVALDWNTPALAFYEKQHAELMDDWLMHRLAGRSLQVMAGHA